MIWGICYVCMKFLISSRHPAEGGDKMFIYEFMIIMRVCGWWNGKFNLFESCASIKKDPIKVQPQIHKDNIIRWKPKVFFCMNQQQREKQFNNWKICSFALAWGVKNLNSINYTENKRRESFSTLKIYRNEICFHFEEYARDANWMKI